MPTRHVDKLLEAYLDNQLSAKALARVEKHLQECPVCVERLYEAKRLRRELGPVLRVTLGQPSLPPRLQQKVKNELYNSSSNAWFRLNWVAPMRFLGAMGNMALMAALAFGAIVVIRGYIPGAGLFYSVEPESGASGVAPVLVVTPVLTTSQTTKNNDVPAAEPDDRRNTLGDTVTLFNSGEVTQSEANKVIGVIEDEEYQNDYYPLVTPSQPYITPRKVQDELALPGGTIAYALYDTTPGIEAYRTYFISPNGDNLRPYALLDVSEPALHPNANNDYALAIRTWEEKSNPRTILTSNFSSEKRQSVANYWEDAQADWSPKENRIIFASQRESDRNWRLYTTWGDGSREDNLWRDGRSPTFAPDGKRFAFESCDKFGNHCGLWSGHLYDTSEDGYKVILEDRLAKSPDWSPTGEQIVYMANPDDNWDLYMMDSDGSNVRRLTDDPAIDGLPAWSPDGEWVAFVSNREDDWGLWILHVDSGKLHQTITFDNGYLTPEDRRPYNEHEKRFWWDEQISWSSN
ncbi:MAG: PD40 domain-containing protein [Anaerolineae bacterium]|nr:PD40 domain-containing protein [Anaerolineae bacterium]